MNFIRILIDPSINGGWNGVAIGFYTCIAALVLTAYLERKKS